MGLVAGQGWAKGGGGEWINKRGCTNLQDRGGIQACGQVEMLG